MRPYAIIALLLVWLPTAGNLLYGQQPAVALNGATCPVTGRPVDTAVSIQYLGQRLYFSSAASIAVFQAHQAKYAPWANYQLALTGQARQVNCPFTGKPVNPAFERVKVGALDIGFCCRACQQTLAQADAQTRLDLAFGDNFGRAFVLVKK
jgi:YHS domain-containing protein